jgi:ABC-2 type transport system permease protein
MTPFAILHRDLLRYWRNPVRTALLFALPLVMAAVFAVVFGGGVEDQISITVLLHDEDDSLLSMLLANAGGAPEMAMLDIRPVGEEGYAMMERGEASALVHLPAGFTADYLAGNPTAIGLVTNPAERFLPKIVSEGVGLLAVGLSEASIVFRSELQQIATFIGGEGVPPDAAVASLATGFNSKLGAAQNVLFPPVVTLETVTLTAEEDDEGMEVLSIFSYFLPGFSILGILFLAQSATRDILHDREAGLLRHLLSAPVTAAEYLVGKCLSVFVVTALGFGLLVLIGTIAGVNWGPPLAVAALVLASALAVGGLLLLIMSFVNSERQGDSLTTIVIIVSSLLGGAFIPASQMPEFLRPLSASTVVYWATEGFNALILESLGLSAIVPNLAVLSGIGLVCMTAGALVLRRKIARGVL